MSTHYEASKHPIIRELTEAHEALNAVISLGLENPLAAQSFDSLSLHLTESLEQVSLLMHAIVHQDARLFTGIVGYPVGMELAGALMKRHDVIFDKHTQQPSDR